MNTSWATLAKCVHDRARHVSLGVAVVGPDDSIWAHGGDVTFPSASTAKIPIMVTIYRMLESNTLTLDARRVLQDEHKANGSGVLRHMQSGLQLTIADLLYLMISISDNTATNHLIRTAGMDRINTTMKELGMLDSRLSRFMLGRLAVQGELENLATANDYARITHAIVTCKAAQSASCHAMLDLLSLQQNNHRIGRYVPKDPQFRWGSKNGTNPGIAHDVGFISSPSGTLVLAIFVQGVVEEVEGEQIIADIAAAAIHDAFPSICGTAGLRNDQE